MGREGRGGWGSRRAADNGSGDAAAFNSRDRCKGHSTRVFFSVFFLRPHVLPWVSSRATSRAPPARTPLGVVACHVARAPRACPPRARPRAPCPIACAGVVDRAIRASAGSARVARELRARRTRAGRAGAGRARVGRARVGRGVARAYVGVLRFVAGCQLLRPRPLRRARSSRARAAQRRGSRTICFVKLFTVKQF